jgi:hypothetical protein
MPHLSESLFLLWDSWFWEGDIKKKSSFCQLIVLCKCENFGIPWVCPGTSTSWSRSQACRWSPRSRLHCDTALRASSRGGLWIQMQGPEPRQRSTVETWFQIQEQSTVPQRCPKYGDRSQNYDRSQQCKNNSGLSLLLFWIHNIKGIRAKGVSLMLEWTK